MTREEYNEWLHAATTGELETEVWDIYKDAHGVRPRHFFPCSRYVIINECLRCFDVINKNA
jgi:hypothetical protein